MGYSDTIQWIQGCIPKITLYDSRPLPASCDPTSPQQNGIEEPQIVEPSLEESDHSVNLPAHSDYSNHASDGSEVSMEVTDGSMQVYTKACSQSQSCGRLRLLDGRYLLQSPRIRRRHFLLPQLWCTVLDILLIFCSAFIVVPLLFFSTYIEGCLLFSLSLSAPQSIALCVNVILLPSLFCCFFCSFFFFFFFFFFSLVTKLHVALALQHSCFQSLLVDPGLRKVGVFRAAYHVYMALVSRSIHALVFGSPREKLKQYGTRHWCQVRMHASFLFSPRIALAQIPLTSFFVTSRVKPQHLAIVRRSMSYRVLRRASGWSRL